jgi:hypothetical protein
VQIIPSRFNRALQAIAAGAMSANCVGGDSLQHLFQERSLRMDRESAKRFRVWKTCVWIFGVNLEPGPCQSPRVQSVWLPVKLAEQSVAGSAGTDRNVCFTAQMIAGRGSEVMFLCFGDRLFRDDCEARLPDLLLGKSRVARRRSVSIKHGSESAKRFRQRALLRLVASRTVQ